MDLTYLVGNIALVCTVASNFAGLQICLSFYRAKSTGNFSALPFITGTACTALWLHYGFLVNDYVLITVNAIAVVLQFSYTGCYYFFSLCKTVLHQQLLFLAGLCFVYFSYTVYMDNNAELITDVVGVLACASSLVACASPLASVRQVVKTKSAEVLPFPIILSAFVVTSLWLFYGILKKDVFLQIPNFIGMLLSGFQLSLFVIYPLNRSNRQD